MTDSHPSSKNKTETAKRVFVTHSRTLPEDQRHTLSEKEKEFEASCKERGVWLEIFCPDDQCLTEEERFEVPIFCEDSKAEKKLWLKLFCPEGSCEITSATQLP